MSDPDAILTTDGYETRLAAELAARREKRLAANIHGWTPRTNNASQISTCALQMWYARMRPTDKKLWDVWTQATVEDGRDEESKVIAELMGDGWEIEAGQAQVDILDKKGRCILTGRIDGKIKWEGHRVPFEVKRVQPNLFKKILAQGADALQSTWYTKKYLWQLGTYLYSHNEPMGILIASDGMGHKAFVAVPLDLVAMEAILKRCEFVEEAVQLKAAPAPLPTFDPDVCGHCSWLHICPVQRGSAEAEIITSGELVELLELRESLSQSVDEHDAAQDRIKELVKEHAQMVVAGRWLVTGEWKERQTKAKEASVSKFWQTKISRIDGRRPE